MYLKITNSFKIKIKCIWDELKVLFQLWNLKKVSNHIIQTTFYLTPKLNPAHFPPRNHAATLLSCSRTPCEPALVPFANSCYLATCSRTLKAMLSEGAEEEDHPRAPTMSGQVFRGLWFMKTSGLPLKIWYSMHVFPYMKQTNSGKDRFLSLGVFYAVT